MGSTVAESRSQGNGVGIEASESVRPPFFVTKDEERTLRINAGRLSPSLVITQATSFDEYARQLMVPSTVMDLARKASEIRLSTNGKADYWTYIQEAIWSMSSDDEDQQSYLKSSSLVSP